MFKRLLIGAIKFTRLLCENNNDVTDVKQMCEEINENVIVIGDSKKLGRIESAIRTGFEAAYYLGQIKYEVKDMISL